MASEPMAARAEGPQPKTTQKGDPASWMQQVPSKLPQEAQLGNAQRDGSPGTPAGFLLDPAGHVGVPLRTGLGSQGTLATDNDSSPLTAAPNIQQ